MKEIIEKEVNVGGKFFNRNIVKKVGIEGGKLYDSVVSKTNELVCFYNTTFSHKEYTYNLYSLVSGKLIAVSNYVITCINDIYYEVRFFNTSKIFYVDNNFDTIIFENYSHSWEFNKYPTCTNKVKYIDNTLIEYTNKNKICITDMNTNEKFEFEDDNFSNLKFSDITFKLIHNFPRIFSSVHIDFENHIYSNILDISQNKFVLNRFVKGNIKDLKVLNGKIFIMIN